MLHNRPLKHALVHGSFEFKFILAFFGFFLDCNQRVGVVRASPDVFRQGSSEEMNRTALEKSCQ